MFAMRRLALVAARRQPTVLSTGPSTARSFYALALPQELAATNTTSIAAPAASRPWWRTLVSTMEALESAVWQMSSTMKKRRSKMNKHKLRKRRKKNRMKSKK